MTCCGSFRFFIKNACTDIGRHKCQFFLAFCSVFIVVLSVIVVNAVIAKGPLIFLQMAESMEGSFDGFIYHSDNGGYHNIQTNTEHPYNFTRIEELYGDKYNLSPRHQYQSVYANKTINETNSTMLTGFEGTLIFMDTDRENRIKLGKDWPFKTLNEGECLASTYF